MLLINTYHLGERKNLERVIFKLILDERSVVSIKKTNE